MEIIQHVTMDEERALYGRVGLRVQDCLFGGPADGESAFKEGADLQVERCTFNLRYPFWHDHGLVLRDSDLTELCRAALWYSDHIDIADTRLHGIKALRACGDVDLRDCDIVSPEFGWFTQDIRMQNCTVQSEYFMLHTRGLRLRDVQMGGKYSFQYVEDAVLEHCQLDTKDALWHAKHVKVVDSVIRGEYLAWYCEDVTFERCRIIGTQPLCYCKGLRLIDCEMVDADLAFEKSEVQAVLTTPVDSIKNPLAGRIVVPAVGEIIRDDQASLAEIVVGAPGAAPQPCCA